MKPDAELQNNAFINYFRSAETSASISPAYKTTITQNFSLTDKTDPTSRHLWISEAAYFIAEARGFTPNHSLNDWLEAEQSYIKIVVDVFLSVCREDDVMTLTGLQQLAKTIGVNNPERVGSKSTLIRLIQMKSRHFPCFKTDTDEFCENQSNCQWRLECKQMVAEYWR